MRALRALAFLSAMVFGLATGLPAAEAKPAVHTIQMEQMKFGPAPSGLRVGDVIVWVNKDMFRHTASAQDKSFEVDLAPGAQARTVVKRAGAIDYFCRYHPGMKGQLVVAP